MIIYGAITCLMMFALSTAIFIAYQRQKFNNVDIVDVVACLLISIIASILWWLTIPVAAIVGGAWVLAKTLSK